MKDLFRGFLYLAFVFCATGASGASSVSNVKFTVQNGTKLVDVTYDLTGATSSVALLVSSDNGTSYEVPVVSVTGHVGAGVTVWTNKHIVWDAGTDWPGQSSNQVKIRVTAWDLMQAGSYAFAAQGLRSYIPVTRRFTGSYLLPGDRLRRTMVGIAFTPDPGSSLRAQGWTEAGTGASLRTGLWTLELQP